MKVITLIGDGMADWPIKELNNQTILEAAETPTLDKIASQGIIGTVKNTPDGMPPASDVANLSALGYNPKEGYTGRGPLEALSMGVKLEKTDIAYRCNVVHIEDNIMKDYSAGHIESEESIQIIKDLAKEFNNERFQFHPGISYRHLLVDKQGDSTIECTPPHDISDKLITDHLPKNGQTDKNVEDILNLMAKAHEFLLEHPINKKRLADGKFAAINIWPWSQGTPPTINNFYNMYALKGGMISAVDLLKGIGVAAGLDVINVPGATGYLDTVFEKKAEYAFDYLVKQDKDFVFIHVEAPDETGHEGDYKKKVQAVEFFDRRTVKVLIDLLDDAKVDYKIMLMPDHYTPVEIKTHSREPVPFGMYLSTGIENSSKKSKPSEKNYTEKNCQASDLHFDWGTDCFQYFLEL